LFLILYNKNILDKKENQKQLKKVLISFVSALLAFQNICHGLTFIDGYDIQDIKTEVNKIGTNFRKNNSVPGLVGYFDIDDVKDIPIYLIPYPKPGTPILDNVCVFLNSADDTTIENVKAQALGDAGVFCKFSEIDTKLDDIKRLQKETPARGNILPGNQTPKKPKTSIIKPVLSVGLVTAVTTIAARVFYDTKIQKQKDNVPQSKIQKKLKFPFA